MANFCAVFSLRVWCALFSIAKSEDVKIELVNVGKSSELTCNFNYTSVTRLTWSYKKYGTNTEIVIYSMNDKIYWRNYEAFCQPRAQFCNITLLHAREENAGRYWCKIATRRGQNRFIACTIEVVVGEMKCQSNIHHPVIGENDCPGLKAYDDTLDRYCSLDYYGNPDLTLRYWIIKNNVTLKDAFYRRHAINIGDKNMKSITLQDELLVKNYMNGFTYECHVENISSFTSCSLPTLEIHYVKFPAQRYVNISINNINDNKCYVEKSDNVNCSYFWKLESVGGNSSIINNSILTTNDIQSSGLYICTAFCQLGNFRECNITATELFVRTDWSTKTPESLQKIVVILTVIILILILILIFRVLISPLVIFFIKRRRSSTEQQQELLNCAETQRELSSCAETQTELSKGQRMEKTSNEFCLFNDEDESTYQDRFITEEEEFTFLEPFSDEDEYRYCHKALRNTLFKYIRLSVIVRDHNFKVLVNTKKLLENENLFAPLAACLQYEIKFDKKIITNIIYPQNENGEPIYNPSGKYMVKLYFNGKYRKVIIDDFLPVDENLKLLCNFSGNTDEYWLSLLEKAFMKIHYFLNFLQGRTILTKISEVTALTGWIPSATFLSNTKFQIEKIIKEFIKGNCLISLQNKRDEHFFIVDINSEEKKLTLKRKKWTNTTKYSFPIVEESFEKNDYEEMYVYWNPAMFDYSQSVLSNVRCFNSFLQYKLLVDLDNDDATIFIHLLQHFSPMLTHLRLFVLNNKDMSHQHSDSLLSMTETFEIDEYNDFFEVKICPLCQELNILVEIKKTFGYLPQFMGKFTLNFYSTSKFNLTKLDDLKLPYKEKKLVQLRSVYDFCVKSENGSNYIFIELQGEFNDSTFVICTLKFINKDGKCLQKDTRKKKQSCFLYLQNIQGGFNQIDISGRYDGITLSNKLDCILKVSSTCPIFITPSITK